MTTIHVGHLGARVALVLLSGGVALWLYAGSGELSLAVIATSGLAAATAVELFAGRHLLDLGIVGDEFVIARRRVWQRRSRTDQEERLCRSAIQGVEIVRSTRPGARGPDTCYRPHLRLASGEAHALVRQPYRSADSAEALANSVGRILGLEPGWRDETG